MTNGRLSKCLGSLKMVWKRARSPEQIEQRRADILRAAGDLFEAKGIDDVSLTAIACRAKISKANVYRYFESREAIFIEILLGEVERWVTELERLFAPLAGSDDIEGFVTALVDESVRRPKMLALMAALPSVLERNVSGDVIRSFKRSILGFALRLNNAANVALPAVSIESMHHFYTFYINFMTGLYPATHPAPHVSEIIAEPEFSFFARDFRQTLVDQSVVVLKGLLAK